MKTLKTISLLLFVVMIFSGCAEEVEPTEVTTEQPVVEPIVDTTDQDAAKDAAIEYVDVIDEYNGEAGENLLVTEVLEMACDGCFIVYLEYDKPIEESDEFEKAKVKIILENLDVIDAEYAVGEIAEVEVTEE